MKIQPNPHALVAAVSLAGAIFLGAPDVSAQQTPPPATQPAPAPSAPTAATPPPTAETPPAASASASVSTESKIHAAPPPPPVQRHVTTPVIVAGALSGAGLASGIIFGVMAAGKNSSYKKTPNNDDALDGERSAFISDISFGVAALFGLTAIALYLLPDEPSPGATDTTAPPPPPKANGVQKWLTAALKGEVLSF
jgi:hypothetical protein